MNWIKCNLPWHYNSLFDKHLPEIPAIVYERVKKTLGISYEEAEDKFCPMRIMQRANTAMDKLELKAQQENEKNWRKIFKEKCLKSKNPDIQAWNKWVEFREKYDKFMDVQPEYIQYQKDFENFNKDGDQKSFCGRGLNKPGTLIETADGNQYLIGDINANAGVCDDCVEFGNDMIIVKYKIIYEKK